MCSSVMWNRSKQGMLEYLKVKVKVKSESESEVKVKVKQKMSFYFYKTFICYRGCLNLNCYMSKKVHENFLMGLKIW